MEDSVKIKSSAYQFSELPHLEDLPKKTSLPPLTKLSDLER